MTCTLYCRLVLSTDTECTNLILVSCAILFVSMFSLMMYKTAIDTKQNPNRVKYRVVVLIILACQFNNYENNMINGYFIAVLDTHVYTALD